MTDVDILSEAIEHRRIVSFTYKEALRIVEPHLVGVNTKGNLALSAFQISGGSGQSFRSFLLEQISGLELTSEEFVGPRPGYNPQDSTMVKIVAAL
ncbi:WYL domain-containing protein [Erythrobacter litoralis]|uniref:Uncharacterized protein n=1 Tax=Erythrobacter litoralis (strain HTCC2594) TaxID=314225 RepID=Q2N9H4_ERYLH|nr:hypothetical protein ELI_07875 [Erythrobacter litoralis HTCC2594]